MVAVSVVSPEATSTMNPERRSSAAYSLLALTSKMTQTSAATLQTILGG